MGSVQRGQADHEEKERGRSAGVMGAWVRRDLLRPTHLRTMLTRLLDQERDYWQPFSLPHTPQEEGGGGMSREGAVWWQWEACERLGWTPETRFTGALLLDLLLLRVKVPPRYLHTLAAATIFLAAKLHEEEENVPATVEVVERGGLRCSWRELLRMERTCLDKLAWHLPSTSTLDFLHVLHALAITSAPRYPHTASISPSRQLGHLTGQLWCVLASRRGGRVRPSLLSLAVLTIELKRDQHEPGLVDWLQALIQADEEELASVESLVMEVLKAATPLQPNLPSLPPPSSRPHKRKVAQCQHSEEDLYQDIKKLYAQDKGCVNIINQDDEAEDTYSDIRHLYTPPYASDHSTVLTPPIPIVPSAPLAPIAHKKKRQRKTKPTFKAKNMKCCLKQALKIPCKISLITTKRIFEEEPDEMDDDEEEEEEEEMEIEEDEEGEEEGPLVEPVGLLKSPVFSPASPEFPDIRHQVVGKEKGVCWQEQVQEVAEQVYRPLTYAQVLRLHLMPLTRALGV